MVDPAAGLHPLRVPLQQVQNQRPNVACDEQTVILLQQQLGQTLQNTLPVLLGPYLKERSHGQSIGTGIGYCISKYISLSKHMLPKD